MPDIEYHKATSADVPGIVRIRAIEWETEDFWAQRITGYMNGTHNPQKALPPRIIYVAKDGDKIVGFVAGHLSRRFQCQGELQWINIQAEYKRKGIATQLFRLLAAWFIEQKAFRICVNVDPSNTIARDFYKPYGAKELSKEWLWWEDISIVLKEH